MTMMMTTLTLQFKASDLADLGGFGGAATTTDDDDDIDEKPPTYMLFSLCCYVVNPVFGMLAIICSILSGNYFDEGEIQSLLCDVVPNLLLRGQPCVWDAQ